MLSSQLSSSLAFFSQAVLGYDTNKTQVNFQHELLSFSFLLCELLQVSIKPWCGRCWSIFFESWTNVTHFWCCYFQKLFTYILFEKFLLYPSAVSTPRPWNPQKYIFRYYSKSRSRLSLQVFRHDFVTVSMHLSRSSTPSTLSTVTAPWRYLIMLTCGDDFLLEAFLVPNSIPLLTVF